MRRCVRRSVCLGHLQWAIVSRFPYGLVCCASVPSVSIQARVDARSERPFTQHPQRSHGNQTVSRLFNKNLIFQIEKKTNAVELKFEISIYRVKRHVRERLGQHVSIRLRSCQCFLFFSCNSKRLLMCNTRDTGDKRSGEWVWKTKQNVKSFTKHTLTKNGRYSTGQITIESVHPIWSPMPFVAPLSSRILFDERLTIDDDDPTTVSVFFSFFVCYFLLFRLMAGNARHKNKRAGKRERESHRIADTKMC